MFQSVCVCVFSLTEVKEVPRQGALVQVVVGHIQNLQSWQRTKPSGQGAQTVHTLKTNKTEAYRRWKLKVSTALNCKQRLKKESHPRLRCFSFWRLLIWVGSSSIWLLNMFRTSKFFNSEMFAGTTEDIKKQKRKYQYHAYFEVHFCGCVFKRQRTCNLVVAEDQLGDVGQGDWNVKTTVQHFLAVHFEYIIVTGGRFFAELLDSQLSNQLRCDFISLVC